MVGLGRCAISGGRDLVYKQSSPSAISIISLVFTQIATATRTSRIASLGMCMSKRSWDPQCELILIKQPSCLYLDEP